MRKEEMIDDALSRNEARKKTDFSRRSRDDGGGATAAGGSGSAGTTRWSATGCAAAADDVMATTAADGIGELFWMFCPDVLLLCTRPWGPKNGDGICAIYPRAYPADGIFAPPRASYFRPPPRPLTGVR